MSYTIKIDRESLAPGAELQINGLGVLKNGEAFFVDDEAAEAFRWANAIQETENDPKDGHLIVSQKKGPTLLQAFENDAEVTVSTTKQEKSKKATPVTEEAAQENLREDSDSDTPKDGE